MPRLEMFGANIIMLMYKRQSDVAKAFVRVQEFYESPAFKDTVFTLGQLREWYSAKHGTWSYYKDWQGFNVPSKAFELFIKGTFDPLSKRERELIELMRYVGPGHYVIASYDGAPDEVREHELAHALYATNVTYRAKVDQLFKEHGDDIIEQIRYSDQNPGAACSFQSLDKLEAKMRELGYNDSVVRDECHAYMAASQSWLNEAGVDFPRELASYLRSNLLRVIEE